MLMPPSCRASRGATASALARGGAGFVAEVRELVRLGRGGEETDDQGEGERGAHAGNLPETAA